jgi:hypothetical protein
VRNQFIEDLEDVIDEGNGEIDDCCQLYYSFFIVTESMFGVVRLIRAQLNFKYAIKNKPAHFLGFSIS